MKTEPNHILTEDQFFDWAKSKGLDKEVELAKRTCTRLGTGVKEVKLDSARRILQDCGVDVL